MVIKSNWLYKQDSTGMKLWKKKWFMLSDMCLYYCRDEKVEGILGSILLPSFHISMLSADYHLSRKYAFKATHPDVLLLHRHSQRHGVMDEGDDRRCPGALRAYQEVCTQSINKWHFVSYSVEMSVLSSNKTETLFPIQSSCEAPSILDNCLSQFSYWTWRNSLIGSQTVFERW